MIEPTDEEQPPTLWLGLYGINFKTQQPLDLVRVKLINETEKQAP